MPTVFDYTVVPEAAPSAAPSAGLARPYIVSSGRAFLGFGLLTPFRRDQKGDFAAGDEAALVASCVAQVLGTRCSAQTPLGPLQGELPWRPEFGSRLYTLRHRNIDDPVTQRLAGVYTEDALELWEPRFRVTGVTMLRRRSTPAAENEDTLVIAAVGDIIRANVPGNQVVVANVRVDVAV